MATTVIDAAGSDPIEQFLSNGAGTEKMRLSSAGYFGIGTTSPISQIDIYKTDSASATVRTVSDTGLPYLQFYRSRASNGNCNADDDVGSIGFVSRQNSGFAEIASISAKYRGNGTTRSGCLIFGTSNSGPDDEKMRLTEDGKIGIGTTTPTYKAEIVHTAPADGTDAKGLKITATAQTSGSAKSYGLWVNASGSDDANYAAIFEGGNVGVGTTSPSVKLEVNGAGKFSGQLDMSSNKIVNVTDPAANQDAATKKYVDDAVAATGGGGWTKSGTVVKLSLITDSVGIGTVSPASKLEVTGDITLSKGGARKIEIPDQTSGNTAGDSLTIEAGSGYGSGNGGNIILWPGSKGASGTPTPGAVGIGVTSPEGLLHVKGDAGTWQQMHLQSAAADAQVKLLFSEGGGGTENSFALNYRPDIGSYGMMIMYGVNANDSFVIDGTNGFVGIGVGSTAPCSLLEIQSDSASPVLTITNKVDSDYDPVIQFKTGLTATARVTMGVDVDTAGHIYLFKVGSTSITTETTLTIDPGNYVKIDSECQVNDRFAVNTSGDSCFIGGGKLGIGTNAPATSALVELSSTTGALLLTRMTTTQRNNLTAVAGMVIFNTDTSKFQGCTAAGSPATWVDL